VKTNLGTSSDRDGLLARVSTRQVQDGMTRRNHLLPFTAAILLATVGVAGCSKDPQPVSPVPTNVLEQSLTGDFTGAGEVPGALSEATTLPTIDRRVSAVASVAARVVYTSTSGIDQSRTQVSGTVLVPKAEAPEGGWSVIAFGHATTGIQPECAPSLSPTLLGSAQLVKLLLKAGYVVTIPDYQGLGMDGTYHPYLDPTTAGYNVIDAVRATRKLVPETSDRWVGLGLSQGGQATWAANDLMAEYGQGLSLFGTVSIAPPADITHFADAASAGELTKEQQLAMQLILATLHNADPAFPLDDYRRGIVKDKWDVLSSCDVPTATQRNDVAGQITPDDLRPASPEAVVKLRGHLQAMNLPRGPAAAPMLVIYGGIDSLVPAASTERALSSACGMGDVIDIQLQADKGHEDIDFSPALAWVKGRFDGAPAFNSCPTFGAPVIPADVVESGDLSTTGEGE
jgi:hypothetical protein